MHPILILALLTGFFGLREVPEVPKPFGVTLGQSLSASFIKRYKCEEKPEYLAVVCKTTPVPVTPFTEYTFLMDHHGRVITVKAMRTWGEDRFGITARSEYAKLKAVLTSKWGKPSKDLNIILNGSLWTEPEDFAKSLSVEDRRVVALWSDPRPIRIILKLAGGGFRATGMQLSYDHIKLTADELDRRKRVETRGL